MQLTEQQIKNLTTKLGKLKTEIAKVIYGQETAIEQILMALLANGHALIEGVPGLAKTKMVKTIAQATSLQFNRIQFTPDLMPSDIVGTELLQTNANGQQQFNFIEGPIMTNLLLADEINRTPPKTQAALLEAMEERAITYAGKQYKMPQPFCLLATQNPIELAGTFPLPEAQLDRFLLKIIMDYPSEANELTMLENTTGIENISINPILNAEEISSLQNIVRQVFIDTNLVAWVNTMVRNTRPTNTNVEEIKTYVSWGAGPRAGQAIILCAKARAILQQRYAVIKEDIETVLTPVLQHRILFNYTAEAENVSFDDLLKWIK